MKLKESKMENTTFLSQGRQLDSTKWTPRGFLFAAYLQEKSLKEEL